VIVNDADGLLFGETPPPINLPEPLCCRMKNYCLGVHNSYGLNLFGKTLALVIVTVKPSGNPIKSMGFTV
jgi:hypothetical protein